MKIEKCPFCGGEAKITARDVEPQGDPWYGKNIQTFVICTNCGACLFDDYFHDGFADEHEATTAWNRRAQPENKPLTLDELRQMDGEPVWVMHQDGSGARWGIVKDTEYGLCAVVDDDTAYWFTDVCGTIAYRSKPKEEHHEAD